LADPPGAGIPKISEDVKKKKKIGARRLFRQSPLPSRMQKPQIKFAKFGHWDIALWLLGVGPDRANIPHYLKGAIGRHIGRRPLPVTAACSGRPLSVTAACNGRRLLSVTAAGIAAARFL
jgi:hypothetical protein